MKYDEEISIGGKAPRRGGLLKVETSILFDEERSCKVRKEVMMTSDGCVHSTRLSCL